MSRGRKLPLNKLTLRKLPEVMSLDSVGVSDHQIARAVELSVSTVARVKYFAITRNLRTFEDCRRLFPEVFARPAPVLTAKARPRPSVERAVI